MPVLGEDRSFVRNVRLLATSNVVNALLFFVPLGLLAGYTHAGPVAVFVTNFMAIVPLAGLLADTTEILADSMGNTIGGLLNATFGNVVELIVAIVALYRGEIRLVQTSMLGSILSNLLLVLGCAFVAGGYNRLQQTFNQTAAQTMSSLMLVSIISLLIPAAFVFSVPGSLSSDILNISRSSSIVLLAIYGFYLVFQLKTHHQFFEGEEEAIEQESPAALIQFTQVECISLLAVVTVIVAICADFLVDSIDSLVETTGISKTFVGFILLPIVGNAAEHVTAILMAVKNKLDLTMNVAVGSSMQIALFLLPFLVVWGWVIDQPMTLYFHGFESTIMLVSVLLANSLIQDGESNWLEGMMLIGTYTIIALAFWYYPETGSESWLPILGNLNR